MPRAICFLAALALVGACDRPGNPEKTRAFAARAFEGTLAYPQSNIVRVSAGDEAAELVLSTPAPVEVVAAWYRSVLTLNHWEIKRDTQDRNGAVTIYAERETRPLWITLRPNVGSAGTTYTLVGTVVDSTKTDSTKR